jgi:predicted nucleic acid-binding protein
MIILDTNVIAELMREVPDSKVASWIQRIATKNLALTVIVVAEILRGLERLPKGKRRQRLEQSFKEFIQQGFRGRIYPFDEEAAYLYGGIATGREKAGLSVDPVDLMIASIAKNLQASIATRNIKDFEGCGITLINPWQPIATNGGLLKKGKRE